MSLSLDVRDYSVFHGELQAVRSVDLAAAGGEITAIVGPNGAGKTSLLEGIAGINTRTHGSITLGEEQVSALPIRCRIASGLVLCPEGRRLFSALTVEDNLRVGWHAGRKTNDEAFPQALRAVVEMFPTIQPLLKTRSEWLSGGQQQLVALARAVVARPAFVLIDEPTLGLSQEIVEALMKSISELASTGVGVLMVEERIGVALSLADSVYVMLNGRLRREELDETPDEEKMLAHFVTG